MTSPLRLLRRAFKGFASSNIYANKQLELITPVSFISHNTYVTKNYIESPFPQKKFPDITIQNYIYNNVDKWPEKTAMVCGVTGRKYTYSQLKTLSKKVALGFLNSGLKPGQVITLILPNLPEFMIAVLGALQAGLIVSTVNPLYNAEEIRHQLIDSESKCVITFPEKLNDINQAISSIVNEKFLPPIIINNPSDNLLSGTRSFRELLEMKNIDETPLKGVNPKADDTAFLLYSSGTTGLPKGVILTHRQVVSNCVQLEDPAVRVSYETTKNFQDAVTCVLPLFHIYGLTANAITNLNYGCKIITLPKFEPQTFLSALKESTISYLVPPIIQYLANNPAVTASNLEKLRTICNGAASISITEAQKLLAKKHMNITSGYGMTEASPVITCSRNNSVDLATVGNPLSNSLIKIINTETGEIMDPSQPGEICIKGPQVMKGYYKNKEATEATLKDGWLHTGDVGYFNNEGNLFIVDRLKELIKVKGFQVAPLELEETLKQHPDVGDVAVVGKPDSRLGEVPVAFVVPAGNKTPSEKELQEFVASKVAEYKRISSVIFTSSIPKNTTGKILRRNLRESLLS